jgi:hypothetical protein
MNPSRMRLALVAAYLLTVLYGASYQQFRHFHLNDPRGLYDTRDYLAMARGDLCQVPETRRYRLITPMLAAAVNRAVSGLNPRRSDPLQVSFYLVNAAAVAGAALLFYLFLTRLGFNSYLALLGATLFLTSRVTVTAAGTPMADAVYLLAIAVIVYLTESDRLIMLALLNPLLALTKEPILPIMLLPLFKRSRTAVLAVSLVVSLAVAWEARDYVQSLCPPERAGGAAGGLGEVVSRHVARGINGLEHLRPLRTLADLQHGFSLVLALAVIGGIVNRKSAHHLIPSELLLLAPLALGYAVLSGNAGRMFFTAYPVVIPYALIAIEHAIERSGAPPSAQA